MCLDLIFTSVHKKMCRVEPVLNTHRLCQVVSVHQTTAMHVHISCIHSLFCLQIWLLGCWQWRRMFLNISLNLFSSWSPFYWQTSRRCRKDRGQSMDLHVLCRTMGKEKLKIDDVIDRLQPIADAYVLGPMLDWLWRQSQRPVQRTLESAVGMTACAPDTERLLPLYGHFFRTHARTHPPTHPHQ